MLMDESERLWSRLAKTDLVKLNRSLRRAFEVTELHQLSATMLDNIVADVVALSDRFPSVPHISTVQHLLWDNAQLRRTLNDCAVSYVQQVHRLSQLELQSRGMAPAASAGAGGGSNAGAPRSRAATAKLNQTSPELPGASSATLARAAAPAPDDGGRCNMQ